MRCTYIRCTKDKGEIRLTLKDVVIVSAVRTGIGSFAGSLKDISAPKLGAIVIKEALKRADVQADQVDEVIMGNVLQAGLDKIQRDKLRFLLNYRKKQQQ